MKLHDHDAEGPPCGSMERHLQRTADGTAGPLRRMYALAHAARCGRCHRFLTRLTETLRQLRTARQDPSEDAIARLSAGKWRDEA